MPKHTRPLARARQSGVTLVITLIVLVAMTLASISLMRSVDTTNVIAGNLAFQQAATHAADAGTEDAINNLLPTLLANKLLTAAACPAGFGYKSFYEPNLDPPNQTWEQFWNALGNCPVTLPQDASGNSLNAAGQIVALSSTISYVIEAMCDMNGQAGTCTTPPPSAVVSCAGSDLGGEKQKCMAVNRRYYRVTSRVQGPRNTVSYVQAIVAM